MKVILSLYRKIRAILSECKYAIINIGRFKVSEPANLHHIGLNVTDMESSLAFYEKYFGAKRVIYNNGIDAIYADKLFLFLNPVKTPPLNNGNTSLWHIGWSGEDAQLEMDWRVKEGIEVHTSITPLDVDHFMYFRGPNKEMIEVYTRKKGHAFEHIHLLATDVDKTMRWFSSYLGLNPVYEKAAKSPRGFKWNYITVNDIDIVVFGKPKGGAPWWPKKAFKPTDGAAFAHIGFSFNKIEPIYEEMKSFGKVIVEDINTNTIYGYKKFFLRGPDQLLVEIVEDNRNVNI